MYLKSHSRFNGRKFNRLLVIDGVQDGKRLRVKCVCDCGNMWEGYSQSIRYGKTKSCGCLRREYLSKQTAPPDGFSYADRLPLSRKDATDALSYDPDTGEFIWKIRPRDHFPTEYNWKAFNNTHAGKPAGKISNGYRVIILFGKHFQLHRLAYLIMTGSHPVDCIDHIDGDPSNNRWSNLRHATVSQNNMNSRLRGSNTSGFKGVSFHKKCRKWRAYIIADGVTHSLGYFDTAEAASEVVKTKRKELHGEFTHHG